MLSHLVHFYSKKYKDFLIHYFIYKDFFNKNSPLVHKAVVPLGCFLPCTGNDVLIFYSTGIPHCIYFVFCKIASLNFFVFQVQMSPFPPTTLPYPSHPHLQPSILPPFGFFDVSFVYVPDNPFPFPAIIPPTIPLLTISLYFISMFLVIFCLLICSLD